MNVLIVTRGAQAERMRAQMARLNQLDSHHENVVATPGTGLYGRSFDVIVFDPMFRHARAEPAGFDLVRRLADPRPLSKESLARARRVARRWVLVKDGAPGWDLARLGLTPLPSARGAHRYHARALETPLEVKRALNTLSPRERAILKLYFEEGLSQAQIAST